MKNKQQLLVFFTFIFLVSCKSAYEKHMSEFNDCVEEKKEVKKYKEANILEALNAYNFEVARDYLTCHPNRNEIREKGFFSSEFYAPYNEDLKLIVESEISYFINNGELKKAESIANEAGIIKIDNKEYDMLKVYKKKSGKGSIDKVEPVPMPE